MVDPQYRHLLSHKIAAIARQWRRLADETLSDLGISSSAGWCLVHIGQQGPCRQTELADELAVAQPSLVRTLDQLQRSGLVHRVQHPQDKRSNLIGLTDKGEALVAAIEGTLEALCGAILADIPDEAIELTAGVLDVIGRRVADRKRQID